MDREVKGLRRKPMSRAEDVSPSSGTWIRKRASVAVRPQGVKDFRPRRKATVNRKISAPLGRGGNSSSLLDRYEPFAGSSGILPSVKRESRIANMSSSLRGWRDVREPPGIHNRIGAKRGSARGKPLEMPRVRVLPWLDRRRKSSKEVVPPCNSLSRNVAKAHRRRKTYPMAKVETYQE